MTGTASIGPLLRELLLAQREDEDAVSYSRLEGYSAALVALSRKMGDPVVWPVGDSAQRLLGAALLTSQGRVRAYSWNTDVSGEAVLLVTITAVTPLPLLMAAEHARELGASEVHACGVAVKSVESLPNASINSYVTLDKELEWPARGATPATLRECLSARARGRAT